MKALKAISFAAAIAGGALCIAATAHAEDATDWSLNIADCPSGGVEVEKADTAVLKATEDALKSGGGFAVLKARLPELETALSHAPASFQKAELCGDKIYVHSTEGDTALVMTDMLVASGLLKDKAKLEKALHGRPAPTGAEMTTYPYPKLSFYVGTTYVEMRQFDRALAALNKGLALDPFNPIVVNEAAEAFIYEHHPDKALELCDRALASGRVVNPAHHALLLRTRGFALGDLNRFADALQSYQESLKYDPDNRGAQNEIRYYQGRLAGAPATATEMSTSDKFRKGPPAAGSSSGATPQQP